ncbi:MAG: ribose-phosphate pyrophosphokinase [Chlamydiota bacterium]
MRAFLLTLFFLTEISLIACPCSSFKLISGSANPALAQEIAEELHMELTPVTLTRFNDGEMKIKIEENIRNAQVFVIQSLCTTEQSTINDNILELYLLIRTLKRASAEQVCAVIPYYGYARQDRKTESRVPISASDIAMLIENAGADSVMCVDLHCGQIQGFFHSTPVDNLYTAPLFVRYFANKKDLVHPVVVSPDAGGVERSKKFLEGLSWQGIDAGLAIIIKQRARAGVIEKMSLVGDVAGCDAIIIDDMCDTAGTLVQAAQELVNHGARRVFACITHPLFSGPALERIAHSCITELVVTDTIPRREMWPTNIVSVSVAPLLAEAIERTHNGESVSHLFSFAKASSSPPQTDYLMDQTPLAHTLLEEDLDEEAI